MVSLKYVFGIRDAVCFSVLFFCPPLRDIHEGFFEKKWVVIYFYQFDL
jgi:hypothetical protein